MAHTVDIWERCRGGSSYVKQYYPPCLIFLCCWRECSERWWWCSCRQPDNLQHEQSMNKYTQLSQVILIQQLTCQEDTRAEWLNERSPRGYISAIMYDAAIWLLRMFRDGCPCNATILRTWPTLYNVAQCSLCSPPITQTSLPINLDASCKEKSLSFTHQAMGTVTWRKHTLLFPWMEYKQKVIYL